MEHIVTGEPLQLSADEAAAMITETLADELEQRFGWQSDLEAGRVVAPWPGPFPPTLRMSRTSQLASALRQSGLITPAHLPPIFDRCSATLALADEEAARTAYMSAVCSPAQPLDETPTPHPHPHPSTVAALEGVREAARLNPFVGEPHIVEAQLLLQQGQWVGAESSARRGVHLLEILATSWDKRMPWQAWINWGRCLGFQAHHREWPTTHGGIESLGAVSSRQRTRGLNVGRISSFPEGDLT